MKIINLTNHNITIQGKEIPPSGDVARVLFDQKFQDEECGIPTIKFNTIQDAEIVGLPAPEENTIFLVSAITRMAMTAQGQNRIDVRAPRNHSKIGGKQWTTSLSA